MRNRGQQTERDILKEIGAKRQPGSGAILGFPNDGVKGRYLIEVKSTQQASLGLKRKWLEDLDENAVVRSKVPTLIIVFHKVNSIGGFSTPRMINDAEILEWVAIPRRDFERLTKDWKKS